MTIKALFYLIKIFKNKELYMFCRLNKLFCIFKSVFKKL